MKSGNSGKIMLDWSDRHPEPPTDGEGPPMCNPRVLANEEAPIATARSFAELRRLRMTMLLETNAPFTVSALFITASRSLAPRE